MKYKTFSDYAKGYSHVKNNTECEDFAASYSSPDGSYHICVICDGHSDRNCFRSAKGARFGCESAVEVLRRFFELYLEQGEEERQFTFAVEDRLKRSIKQCWDQKVMEDIREFPLMPEELETLSERVRGIYKAGQGLQNIYGATFLTAALCGELFLVMQIGDGVLLCIDSDGTYYEPLAEDPKSETGSPASLCDTDLFTRSEAFRSLGTSRLPQAVVVSSDGVGDCMDASAFKETVRDLFRKLEEFEEKDEARQEEGGLTLSQRAYLERCLAYWADQGHGAEDDCSMAGIYDREHKIPDVHIPLEEVNRQWKEFTAERERIVQDYERKKKDLLNSMDRNMREVARIGQKEYKAWIELREKIEDQRQILQNILKNEKEKIAYIDEKLKSCQEYFQRAGSQAPSEVLPVRFETVDERYLREDQQLVDVKAAQKALFDRKAAEKEALQKYEQAREIRASAGCRYRMAQREGNVEFYKVGKELLDNKEMQLIAEQNLRAAKEALQEAKKCFQETFVRARKNDD